MIEEQGSFIDLGEISDVENEIINSKPEYKIEMNKLLKEAMQASKLKKCYFCGKDTEGFCNSHSIPAFCLKNISTNGDVMSINSLIGNPFMKKVKGVNNSGTFHIICRDCDSKIFSDYENPDNYIYEPTPKMLAQIAMKNNLYSINKRLREIQLYKIIESRNPTAANICQAKNYVNNLDLKEYIESFNRAKKSIEKNNCSEYYICYFEKLDYVVPFAFQDQIALLFDFDGNIINNIFNPLPEYKVKTINICIFPLKDSSVILLFIENGDKRYRSFYKQFRKLSLEDRLLALTFIVFAYSENIFFSKTIANEVTANKELCKIAKSGFDYYTYDPSVSVMDDARKTWSLNNRSHIPNLLSYEHRIDNTRKIS